MVLRTPYKSIPSIFFLELYHLFSNTMLLLDGSTVHWWSYISPILVAETFLTSMQICTQLLICPLRDIFSLATFSCSLQST